MKNLSLLLLSSGECCGDGEAQSSLSAGSNFGKVQLPNNPYKHKHLLFTKSDVWTANWIFTSTSCYYDAQTGNGCGYSVDHGGWDTSAV